MKIKNLIFKAILLMAIMVISSCQSSKDISYDELISLRSTHTIKNSKLEESLREVLNDSVNYSKYDFPILLIISKKMSNRSELCISKSDFNIFKSNRPDTFKNLIGYSNFDGIPVLLFGDNDKAFVKLENIDFYDVVGEMPEYGRGNPPIFFEPRMKCYEEKR